MDYQVWNVKGNLCDTVTSKEKLTEYIDQLGAVEIDRTERQYPSGETYTQVTILIQRPA